MSRIAPGFGAVADAFAAVMAGSTGAFSVVRGDRTLVELHGGGWGPDTVAVLFSGTKGLAAAACAALAGPAPHGLDPAAPVSRYWPEFAAAGKEQVTIAHVLAHTAGLPYVDPAPGSPAADLDDRAGAAALARQAPLWEPGSRVAYHALTFGHLVAELLRRVTGRDPRAVVEQVAARVPGVRVFLRTPPPPPAGIVRAPGYRLSTFLRDDPPRRAVVDRMYRSLGDPELVNTPAWYRSGALAGAGVAGATAMARFYAALADPARSPVPAAALARATTAHAEGTDAVNDRPLRYGLGFELADPVGTYGPEPVAFGHSGAGGGRHGGWPERGVGFSFLPGELRAEDVDDRASTLLAAVHACL